jgi:hypothetical protein
LEHCALFHVCVDGQHRIDTLIINLPGNATCSVSDIKTRRNDINTPSTTIQS